MKNMLKPIALFFSALHSYPFCTFCSEFLLLQGLSSLLRVFFSPHHLIVKLIITISSAKLFFQLFWFFPPFPLAFMGSGCSCIGWPPLPQGLPRSCKWPVWVFFLRTPVLQKPHLCLLDNLPDLFILGQCCLFLYLCTCFLQISSHFLLLLLFLLLLFLLLPMSLSSDICLSLVFAQPCCSFSSVFSIKSRLSPNIYLDVYKNYKNAIL